jgi:hypothetical protein
MGIIMQTRLIVNQPIDDVLNELKNPNLNAFFKLPLRLIPGFKANYDSSYDPCCNGIKYLTPGLFNGNVIEALRIKLSALKNNDYPSEKDCAEAVTHVIAIFIEDNWNLDNPWGGPTPTIVKFLSEISSLLNKKYAHLHEIDHTSLQTEKNSEHSLPRTHNKPS